MKPQFAIFDFESGGYLSSDYDSFTTEIKIAVTFDTHEEAKEYIRRNLYGYYSIHEIFVNI